MNNQQNKNQSNQPNQQQGKNQPMNQQQNKNQGGKTSQQPEGKSQQGTHGQPNKK
jgi:hypothetical protein